MATYRLTVHAVGDLDVIDVSLPIGWVILTALKSCRATCSMRLIALVAIQSIAEEGCDQT